MITITRQITIAAEPPVIWRVLTDVERWPEWTPAVTSLEALTTGGFAPQARYRIKQPWLLPTLLTVELVDEGRRFLWATTSPGLRFEGDHLIEPANDGTATVTLEARFTGVAGEVAGRLSRGLVQKYVTMEAEGLKRRAEAYAKAT